MSVEATTNLNDRVAIGIDVAEARKGIDLVAIDRDRRVVASHGHLDLADLVGLVLDSIRPSMVCVDSPSGWSTSGGSRQAERELARLGISAFATGQDPGDHPFYRWMRVGFAIFGLLAERYPLFYGQAPAGTAAEVFPNASAVLLARRQRASEESKQFFRRQVLHTYGVDEAILPTVDRVDAALGALTGLLALEGHWSTVGDPDEGVILLPVAQLPAPRTHAIRLPRMVRPSRPEATVSTSANTCLCGCGVVVRRRFLPGHDAKLKSRLIRLSLQGDAEAMSRLEALGWL
jgi:predicted nuclease with RNAse H fold